MTGQDEQHHIEAEERRRQRRGRGPGRGQGRGHVQAGVCGDDNEEDVAETSLLQQMVLQKTKLIMSN